VFEGLYITLNKPTINKQHEHKNMKFLSKWCLSFVNNWAFTLAIKSESPIAKLFCLCFFRLKKYFSFWRRIIKIRKRLKKCYISIEIYIKNWVGFHADFSLRYKRVSIRLILECYQLQTGNDKDFKCWKNLISEAHKNIYHRRFKLGLRLMR
jgi:hypothetical protein